ncbi:MAG: PAS domain S-box protein [Aphanocapsa sp. GSE-SYN-MK-11-07L]|jgi:PAS domain S-box-containing protein|nr:PAS domain S-box protein [Aphanocapsa sp. GSE-SYN-MK-11-07L]
MKILVVEDDQDVALILKLLFSSYHYAVDVGTDGETGWQMVDAFEYDLIVLDVLLPGIDGISLCQKIRAKGFRVPILLLTGQGGSHQKAIALNAGADDYVVKPFDSEELMARVQALLRRGGAVAQPVLEWGHLQLDPGSKKVNYGTQLLTLTPKESAILELFLRHAQQVFSARAILDHAWSSAESPGEEAVRVHIKELRQKLTAAGAPKDLIKTIYRVGYRLNPLYSSALATETKESPLHIAELRSVNQELRSVLEELQATQAALQRQNTELEIARQRVEQELQQRQQVEQQLQAAHDQLERQVTKRTAELIQSNINLQQQKHQWQALFDHALDAIAITDDEGNYVDANLAACDLFGVSKPDLLNLNIADFAASEARSEIAQLWQQFLQQGQMLGEFPVQRPDGTLRETEFSAIANFIPHRHLSILRDISDRKRADEDLRQSEELLSLFFSQSLDGFFFMMLDQPLDWDQTTDKAAAIEYAFTHQQMTRANDAVLAQYNCTREQFLGLTPADLFAHDLDHGKTVWREFFDAGHLHVETNERKFDGSSMVIEGDYICLYDRQGRITGHFGIQRDISDRVRLEAERKQAETALLEKQHLIEQITNSTSAILYIYDLFDQRNIYVNPQISVVLGYSPAEIQAMGSNLFINLAHPDDLPRVLAQIEQCLTAKDSDWLEIEYRMRHANGEWRWLQSKDSVLNRTADGSPQQMMGTAIDITDRKQLEIELRQISTALSHAVEGISRLDSAGNYLSVNDAYARMVGYSPPEMVGINWQTTVHPDDLAAVNAAYQQMLSAGKVEVEARGIRKDGSIFDKQLLMILAEDEQQQLIGHYCFLKDITDRKQLEVDRQYVEANLRESEAKYRSLFESIYEGFCAIEVLFDQNQKPVDYCFLQVNPKFEQQTGIKDAVGRRIREIAPQHEEYWFEIFGQVALTGQPIRFENYAAELQRWYDVYAFPIADPQLHHLGILFNEISDRKEAEAAQRESEQRFRSAFDYAAIGMALVATDGRWLQVNRAVCEIVGYSEAELLSTTFQAITYPEDLEQDLEFVRQMLAGQIRTYQMEKRYIHKLGHLAWILLSVSMVYDAQDQPQYFISQIQDISDQKRLAAERQQAEQKIREQAALIDIATDAIFVSDLEGRILLWNRGAEQLFGWTAEEALSKEIKTLQHPNLSDLTAEMESVLSTGFWQGEPEKVTKTGKNIIVASRWTLMRDQSGQPKSILIVNTDITTKKQLEAQFYRTQRLESLGTLTSGIAHDLNNIFTPILAISQLMRSTTQTELSERSQEMLAMLENSAKRGAGLVKQIVTFARGTEGRRTTLQIRPLLLEVVKVLEQTWPKSIQIRTAISPQSLGMIYADPTQLHRILMNLCVNARDGMPNGGVLTLSVENRFVDANFAQLNLDAQVGDYVVIAVSDTGSGIPPEIRDRIFDPFFTTKAPGQGTGLGLSTILGIIKSYGGFLQVYSQVGQGSQFIVYLPTTEEIRTEGQPTEELPQGHGELVLIVDDDADVQKTNQALLESYCYETLIADDGLEAIECYAKHQDQIGAVLLDIMMPKMDGITAVRTLKKINPQAKIIAISGLAANREPVLSAGASLFLAKPYTTEDLLISLHRLLQA